MAESSEKEEYPTVCHNEYGLNKWNAQSYLDFIVEIAYITS